MRSTLWLLGVLSIVALSACEDPAATMAERPAASSAVLVETEIAELALIVQDAESVGTLVGNESVTITAKLTEQVSAVYFEGGELVEAGAVLVELIDVEQLALLREAEAKLRETQLQLDRFLTLGKDIATAAEIDVARARVDANAALLEALRSRIADRTIRAPFDGVIGLRRISVGALLTPGTVIAELDDVNPMKLDFTLPEHYLSQIDIGDSVDAKSTAWDGESFAGEVTQIGSRVDPATRAFSVRALIDNKDARLRPGMLMAVNVSLGEVPGIVVSETALVQSGAQSSVFIVDDESIARRVTVEIGRRMPGLIEIRSGLSPGDRVVRNGQMTLRPGVKVRESNLASEADSLAGIGA
ncbi:efflux RND transporter periplasmic adaptor subunit [Congregibacter brevis]|uniref:Efflux RND transporter periplasmic adaptor subunit n=1 Tax=Congregibacter brevis TaxID=3081201 RepID=A0ABZ0IDY7_9GAMM|nr:efflux RND transporter periplasmic adaptor subunit [Congregibacter sp. IMCC45268]